MENNNQIIPEKIHLNQIKWIKENTLLLDENLNENPIYDIVVAHNMMHNLDKNIVKIRIFVDIVGTIDSKNIKQGGNYEVDFFYQIEDLNEQFQITDGKPIFNGLFVSKLLGISYSTMRGMLFSTWKNTFLESLIIPVISVPQLLNSTR